MNLAGNTSRRAQLGRVVGKRPTTLESQVRDVVVKKQRVVVFLE